MREQYDKFDCKLNENIFLKKHPECLPFIGEEYENIRLLLIGESHYVYEKAIDYVRKPDFYDISFADLPEGEYKEWIDTRSVFEYRAYDQDRFEHFFSNIATEIARIIFQTDNPSIDQKRKAMHQYAFINYFKRPSYNEGKTISGLTDKDYKYAYEVTKYIIDVLKPNLIIFVSQKAYNAFCDGDKDGMMRSTYKVRSVSHPSSSWWNRKRKDGKCAREEFYDYISEHIRNS